MLPFGQKRALPVILPPRVYYLSLDARAQRACLGPMRGRRVRGLRFPGSGGWLSLSAGGFGRGGRLADSLPSFLPRIRPNPVRQFVRPAICRPSGSLSFRGGGFVRWSREPLRPTETPRPDDFAGGGVSLFLPPRIRGCVLRRIWGPPGPGGAAPSAGALPPRFPSPAFLPRIRQNPDDRREEGLIHHCVMCAVMASPRHPSTGSVAPAEAEAS